MRLFKREQENTTYEMTVEEFEDRVGTLPEEDIKALSRCFVLPANLNLLLGVSGCLSEEERTAIKTWADEASADTRPGQTSRLVVSRQDESMDGELVLKNIVTVPTQPLTRR